MRATRAFGCSRMVGPWLRRTEVFRRTSSTRWPSPKTDRAFLLQQIELGCFVDDDEPASKLLRDMERVLLVDAGRQRCGVGLRLAYRVAQVCNADARDHRRVAKDGWRAGEVVKESNSGAKKKR